MVVRLLGHSVCLRVDEITKSTESEHVGRAEDQESRQLARRKFIASLARRVQGGPAEKGQRGKAFSLARLQRKSGVHGGSRNFTTCCEEREDMRVTSGFCIDHCHGVKHSGRWKVGVLSGCKVRYRGDALLTVILAFLLILKLRQSRLLLVITA